MFGDIGLLLFDIDGTIADRQREELLPDASRFFDLLAQTERRIQVALVTNQGGVGLRWWRIVAREAGAWLGDPDELPTLAHVQSRINTLRNAIRVPVKLYVSYAYQSKSSRKWGPVPPQHVGEIEWSRAWRKPAPGMLLQAMRDTAVIPSRTLMIGDQESDAAAASAAGVAFMKPDEFWNIAGGLL